MQIKAAVEAILFLADKPLRAEVLALLLAVELDEIKDAIAQLQLDYSECKSALKVYASNSINAFEQLVTADDFAILDSFDPTDSLQDTCPLITSVLSSPTFDAYALRSSGYSLFGEQQAGEVFNLTGENIELALEEQYQKLQSELIKLRQQVRESITDELNMEPQVAQKWQQAGETKETAELQLKWEKARSTNRRLRERLVKLEKTVQTSYIRKQNALAFAKVSEAIHRAKMFLTAPARKRLLATLCKTFTGADTKHKLEILLFQSADEFSLDELAEFLDEPAESITRALHALKHEYAGRHSAVQINTGNFYSMQLRTEFLELPYRNGVPQSVKQVKALISDLQTCRRKLLQAAETTNLHVKQWHEQAKAGVRTKDELNARKSLTYWFFCKEHYESLHQFSDGIDLRVARLRDLQDRLQSVQGTKNLIAMQQSLKTGSPLDAAQAAISEAQKDIKRLDDLVNRSKDNAQTWAHRASMAANMQQEELEKQALRWQEIYEKAAAEIEERSLQAIALHELIKQSASFVDANAAADAADSTSWADQMTGEFDIVDMRDFLAFPPKAGQVAVSDFVAVQVQHLLSLASACSDRSETFTSETSLQNRAQHVTLQLAQLANMLTDTNVDWRSLGPNPFMEMAAQVENELALLKESEC